MIYKQCNICHRFALRYLFIVNTYRIYQCTFCKVALTIPYPFNKDLIKYYRSFNYKTGFITEKLIRKEAKDFLKKIPLASSGSLLDIGCGAGFYLDEAQKVGWQVTGVEMSKQLVDYAVMKLNAPVIVGDFTKVKLPNSKFDVIVLSQVIEHLTNPIPMLQKIKLCMKNEGVLYIATPNISSWLFKIQKQDFPYMIPPEHVYFYSPQSLALLLSQNGFKVKSLSTYGYQQDLAGIIKTLVKGKVPTSQNVIIEEYHEYPKDPMKVVKYILFDKIFCGILHSLLNITNKGSMIRLFAQKV